MDVLHDSAPVVAVEELSPAQAHALFDRQARRLVGMSGAEFLRRYRAGDITEDPAQPGVTELVMLLPFGEA